MPNGSTTIPAQTIPVATARTENQVTLNQGTGALVTTTCLVQN